MNLLSSVTRAVSSGRALARTARYFTFLVDFYDVASVVKINKGDSHATEKSVGAIDSSRRQSVTRSESRAAALLLFCYIIADKISAENKAHQVFMARNGACLFTPK